MSCFSLFFKKKEVSRATHTIDVEDEVSSVQNAFSYTYRELQRATDNFKPANKVGEGGFGSVYKGMLRDGTMAAVKVLSAESRQEGNHRILVYGYLENNSLAQTLLGGGGHSNIQFSWPTRRKICIGVARGLAFLHEEVQPHVVHRDIKASNVLLDNDLEPRISDFGLAKLFPANLTHISTNVAGTAGYLAPEYAIRGQLTRKADIYSFGVLLLEIVSGRSNTNRRLPPEEQYLVERVWEFYQKQELVNLVDTSLAGNYDVEEACNYLKIGLLCTQDVPKQRPSMSTAVLMLMGEIEVSDKISRPGMLSEFMSFKGDKMRKHGDEKDQNNKWEMKDSGKGESSSSSLGLAETSNATMTFSSIYDRDN